MRLNVTLQNCGYVQGIMDPQVWRKFTTKVPRVYSELAILGELLLSMLTTHR